MTDTHTAAPASPRQPRGEGTPWTPGPWRFGERNPYPDEPMEISVLATNPRTGGDYCVAVAIPCGAGDRTRDVMPKMTEANARLIAAAPEQYTALQGMVALWDGIADEDTPARHLAPAALAAARQALAAARRELTP